ncbi:glutamate--tRNA ligase [Geotoga petraea]|uniref:Glutamate--tRNA ligase n=1 Tax=Geotoga petraea TaxID=28234 RepID=A0A4Z0VZP2_9BACT|nr:glutamate--tRNA ligase [Geotoga petraea]TGG87475.1 glutamate--tRNA ligase [Geotoga petraea]
MIRTRFAPSPTGYLHVGGVRTALFNWYHAKSNNGKIILRIEDTDTKRSTEEFENLIYEDFDWLGMDFDESPKKGGDCGPYKQSYRYDIYKRYINNLIEEEKAYYVFYDKSGEEIGNFAKIPENYANKNYTVKIKVEKNKEIKWNDLLKGEISFNSSDFEDFIILRSNGVPVYNFTVVVDDHLMGITDVIRGEDHISNTPKQIIIYEALGFSKPKFGHLPLILGEDKTPLSKRHGGVSVSYFREEGILPEALLNYLSLLGWNNEEEIYDVREKYKNFNIRDVSKRSSVFDYEKLKWVNEKTLRSMDEEKVSKKFLEWLKFVGIKINVEENYIKDVISISKEKVQDLKGLWEFSKNYFYDDFEYEEKYKEKFVKKEWFEELINIAIILLEDYDEKISLTQAEEFMKSLTEKKITGKKNTYQSIRGALLGKLVTPGLYETISVMGKKEVVKRLRRVVKGA